MKKLLFIIILISSAVVLFCPQFVYAAENVMLPSPCIYTSILGFILLFILLIIALVLLFWAPYLLYSFNKKSKNYKITEYFKWLLFIDAILVFLSLVVEIISWRAEKYFFIEIFSNFFGLGLIVFLLIATHFVSILLLAKKKLINFKLVKQYMSVLFVLVVILFAYVYLSRIVINELCIYSSEFIDMDVNFLRN